MNMLGITVCDTLTLHRHITALVAKSAHSFYVLKTIHTHGLDRDALWGIALVTPVSQLLYTSPVRWGYLKADEGNRLLSVIEKAKWYSYLPCSFNTLGDPREDSDEKLFFSSHLTYVLTFLLTYCFTPAYNLPYPKFISAVVFYSSRQTDVTNLW